MSNVSSPLYSLSQTVLYQSAELIFTFLQIILYNSSLYELLICSVLPTLHLLIKTIHYLLPDSPNEEKCSR